MPSGEVHIAYWKKGLPVATGVSIAIFCYGVLYNSYAAEFALWLIFWYWMGRYIDPDLDLMGTTMAEGRMLRELDFLGVLLVPLFTFYAAFVGYIIKKFKIGGAIGGSHRTWLTHSLVPGTLIRQAFICLFIYYVVDLVNFGTGVLLGGSLIFYPYDLATFVLAQFTGLGSADAIHILLDKFYSKKGVDE